MAKKTKRGTRTQERPDRAIGEKWDKLYHSPLFIAVVAGIFALGGTLTGSYFTGKGQNQQIQETRGTELRETREKIYSTFLDATYTAWQARIYPRLLGRKFLTQNNYIKIRERYMHALNQVYVYGSDDAWSRAQAIDSIAPFDEISGMTYDFAAMSANDELVFVAENLDKFKEGILSFRAIMCREISPVPRKRCGEAAFDLYLPPQ
jgi:hypothetical protein